VGGKRFKLANLMLKLGVSGELRGRRAASLMIFNYHRLWPSRRSGPSVFDDGVFGPDAEDFRLQMEWLKRETHVLDEQGILNLANQAEHPKGAVYSAVTFDDAYVDCHTIAAPILKQVGIRAIFFVPVRMIESRRLGWWDQAAYMLKACKQRSIAVRGEEMDLRADFGRALRRILDMFKLQPFEKTERLLSELSTACGVSLPTPDLQSAELMSWDQIRDLHASGHAIGSHTLSHRVLATLSPEEQAEEIGMSKAQLSDHLGEAVRSFAYPVGGPRHFNDTSVNLVRSSGYLMAFTFNTGMETLPLTDLFRIRRESAHSFDLLQAKVRMPSLMGIRAKIQA
jgi:peptidoglycan/xylan/chitin deacetylase (PgdA/CDA1 family)